MRSPAVSFFSAISGSSVIPCPLATSLSTIVEFVANGQGITLLPEIALKKEAAGDRIHIHRLASPGAGRMLSLVWREATPFAELFAEIAGIIRASRPAQAV